MMTNAEKIFTFINEHAQKTDKLYLEGVIDVCNNWLEGKEVPTLAEPVTKEEIRRGLQLAILNGMKQQAQVNHQMTPDSIGMLLAHITSKLMQDQSAVTILDPAVGTGNLLYTVMNYMPVESIAFAVEIDDLLVRLAALTAELLEQEVSFIVQDALRPLFIDPVDVVVTDVPVGYYPDDDNALNYQLMPSEGHSYAHHLFIEQSLKHTKPGGYALFIVPENLFESEHAAQLHEFLKKESIIRAVLQLPTSLFKNAALQKSILVLQKPSEQIKTTPEVLLAKVPNMSNKEAMASFLQDFDLWVRQNE